MAPLIDCMKGKSFLWMEEAELAFQVVKEKLTTAPILVLPDSSKVFELHTDASKVTIGGFLSQVVQAVKHWRHYLFHKEFVLFTEHDSLRHIHTQDKVSHKHGRWLAFLEKFTFVVRHETGVSNRVADALSRRNSLLVTMQVDVPGLDVIHDMVTVDPYFLVVLQGVQYGEKTNFVLHDRFLFKENQLCIPDSSLCLQIIKELLGEGHVGRDRTLQLVQASYFWLTMRKEVDRYVKSLWKMANTQLNFSGAYHPQTNGKTKVVNMSLGNLLRCLVADHVKAWDQKLCQAEFAHNHAVNRSNGSVPKRVHGFIAGLHDVHKAVRDNLDHFPIGEYNKLSSKKIGPLEIVKKMNSNAYRLKLPSYIRCSYVFNVKHLLPYHGDSSDEDSVGNSRTNFVYPGGNDVNPSIKERADLFLEAQDRVRKIGDIVNEVQSAFIAERQILDGSEVINAIHGVDGKMGKAINSGASSCWTSIVREVEVLKQQVVNFFEYLQLNMGNGESTTFYEDRWLEGSVLKDIFPRLYVLKTNKKVSMGDKLKDFRLDSSFRRKARGGIEQVQYEELSNMVNSISLILKNDRYVWSLSNSGDFSVASFRKVIDENRYPGGRSRTRWVKYVPIKVNVIAWKIKMDALPTRLNISRRDEQERGKEGEGFEFLCFSLRGKCFKSEWKAQAKRLFGNKNVWVKMHRGIAWDKVENPNPQSTPQVLLSFEEYTPPVTYLEEVEETLGTPIEAETLDETQLEDLNLNTCNHDLPLSSREVPSFDEPKPNHNPYQLIHP
uniref:Putative reverse transcriptase domain-containing protein n=1 Tax=Tanacetum cinerariifolium TaxID=118510 RepID=A0A6L2MCM0_TANCI|nr:putative reverse transcriptase domain-containing protein [Tanacetum cinerariifolium]